MGDRIRIPGIEVPCIIGLFERERVIEQPLALELTLSLDLRAAGRKGRINDTVDYSEVAREVTALLRFRRYRLLEAAAEETAALVLGLHPKLDAIAITLTKPNALKEEFGTGASVSIERNKTHYPRRREVAGFGGVDILLETDEAGLYLLHVEPGKHIPRHHHRVMRELEWLVRGELWQEGNRVERLMPVEWQHGQVHDYENRSSKQATVFCCDTPPFIREDEIEERFA